jgi:hypothetical protein
MTSDVSRWPPGLRRRFGGVLLAVTAGVVDLLVWGDDRRLAEGVPVWVVPAATALMGALLLARRRHPLPVLGAQAGYALVIPAIPHYEPFACASSTPRRSGDGSRPRRNVRWRPSGCDWRASCTTASPAR